MTPDLIKKTYARALKAQQAGRWTEAEKGYARIIAARPGLAEAQFNMGRVLAAQVRLTDAARHFEAALRAKPGQPEIWLAYLDMASRHPKPDNLEKLLGRVGSGLDHLPDISFLRGLVAARRGDAAQAETLIGAAIAMGLKSARAQTELGLLHLQAGEDVKAMAAFDAALALNPKDAFALISKAGLLRGLGKTDEALACATAAISADPATAQHYYTYASITKLKSGDPMIAQMQKRFAATRKGDLGRIYLGHALAKVMEETGAQDQMFRFLSAANQVAADRFPYDHDADRQAVAKAQETFEGLSATPDSDAPPDSRPRPIFVTGMPRSGTTLVEQILASHSACTGGGELGLLSSALAPVLEGEERPAADLAAALRNAGETYRHQLSARFGATGCVTDKSISTYASIGFVRHALPDAKIIVIRRNPADNALSIYKNLFKPGSHRYATDLRAIARFCALFEAQLDFWRDQMPGSFYELQYEALIADPEPQSRALVAAAGLEWEDACLAFYDTSRRVDTLSSAQVRQPIYRSSVGGWERYRDDLATFIEEYAQLTSQTL